MATLDEEKRGLGGGTWSTDPLPRWWGRRGPLVLSVLIVGAAVLVAVSFRRGPTDVVAPANGRPLQDQTVENPIRLENARSGTRAWQVRAAPAGSIEGYASAASVAPDSSLDLHVSTTPPARYRVNVYRLGWYGGAGARLMDCGPACSGTRQGMDQGAGRTSATGEQRAEWPVTDELETQADWVSGYYVAKLVLASGPDQGTAATVTFLVRPPAARTSAILVQAAVNTWQAYNNWGGKSLYDFNSTERVPATRVSLERPLGQQLNQPLTWEYPLVRFLEREGYDVAYVTDVDTHRDPAQLKRQRMVMTAGHDEYWSREMRDGFEAALAAGTNLVFMGGNTAHWQIRYDDAERSMIGYKSSTTDPEPDPALRTDRFRALPMPRPECRLLGVQSRGGLAAQDDPPRSYQPAADALRDPWFANTGLSTSSVLADLVGYEWDVVHPECATPPLTVLFHYEGRPSNADAVRYTAPSGARVFSTGTLQFSWGLDDWDHPGHASPPLQQFMRNALDDLTR